ncbi:MAG: hypothetical protein JW776_04430 [Candidatus Lokiarchaeota archaeon]|nr:hypothetical protein [Candidatus Lokiarchaeota archaeon]
MNFIRMCIWFFVFFLNYSIFHANLLAGIVFLLIEILIYNRIKGGSLVTTHQYRSTRFRANRAESVENSNATLLVLELMKMERMNHPESAQNDEMVYYSQEHKQLRKAFER